MESPNLPLLSLKSLLGADESMNYRFAPDVSKLGPRSTISVF